MTLFLLSLISVGLAIAGENFQTPAPEIHFAERERSKEVVMSVKAKKGFRFDLQASNHLIQRNQKFSPLSASVSEALVFILPVRDEAVSEFSVCNADKSVCETQKFRLELESDTQQAKMFRQVPYLESTTSR